MCPACLTTLALVAAGTGSAGGLTAFVISKVFRRKPQSRDQQAAARASDSKEQP